MKVKFKYLLGIVLILVVTALCFALLTNVEVPTPTENSDIEKSAAMGKALGFVSLLPAILAVVLAFITKQVVLSLFVGLFSGFVILESVEGVGNFFSGLGNVFDRMTNTILTTSSDGFKVAIIILCLAVGGVVAVINASGGFQALGKKLTRGINSPKRALLTAQLLGTSLFFDDYANTLITGPVMRPITDKQGISREKLAYIADSTAAPIAGIAIITSWIAAELSAIDSGFIAAGISGSAFACFFGSIPYFFYNFIAVAMVLFLSLTGREYGPMLYAERRARAGQPKKGAAANTCDAEEETSEGSIWSAILPLVTMIVYSFVGFYQNGMENAVTVVILMRAALLSSIVAIFMACLSGKLNISKAISSWIDGASGILLTAVILVLAWSLSEVIALLGSAYYLVDIVIVSLPYFLLPMLIFLTCCAISFATGSFGCMVIVMPIALPLAYETLTATGINFGEQYLFSCVAAVISGSIFGDHCSPISDTTILSSLGADCENLDHAETQLPYGLTAVVISALTGFLPAGFGVPPFVSIPLGLLMAFLAVRFLGKRV